MKALALLTADIGVAEDPPGSNRNKYGKYWGQDGVPYCAQGVSWAYREAGAPLPDIQTSPAGKDGYWAYVPFGYGWAVNHDELTDTPEPGDIVCFGDDDHTGLFERWITPGFSFYSVEANTSDEDDVNGIYVARRHRYMDWVHGFWHPEAAERLVDVGPVDEFEFQQNAGGVVEREFEMYAAKTNTGMPLLVDGCTYRVLSGPWDETNAGLIEMARAGLIPAGADGETPLLPVLGDNALRMMREVA